VSKKVQNSKATVLPKARRQKIKQQQKQPQK
jgi:hypothetical protein